MFAAHAASVDGIAVRDFGVIETLGIGLHYTPADQGISLSSRSPEASAPCPKLFGYFQCGRKGRAKCLGGRFGRGPLPDVINETADLRH